MTSLRAAINPTLAETVRKHEEQRREAAELRHPDRIRARRDRAIAALIQARKSKKKSRPLLAQVLKTVAQLRMARELEAGA